MQSRSKNIERAACQAAGKQGGRRRGRPTREEAEVIDRRILAVALAVFLDRGFQGATVEEIADSAGISRPTIYLRFPDKRSLFLAVLKDRMAEWSRISKATDWMLGETLRERLRHYAVTMLTQRAKPEIAAVIALVHRSRAEDDAEWASLREALTTHMTNILERELESHAAPGKARILAAIFLAMLSAVEDERRNAVASSIGANAETAVSLFLDGKHAW